MSKSSLLSILSQLLSSSSSPFCTAARVGSFNSFPVAVKVCRDLGKGLDRMPTFNSFPVAVGSYLRAVRRMYSARFQFFPSCCNAVFFPIDREGAAPLSFNSFPVAVQLKDIAEVVLRLQAAAFNSFPVAVHGSVQHPLPDPGAHFRFFPSCCRSSRTWTLP